MIVEKTSSNHIVLDSGSVITFNSTAELSLLCKFDDSFSFLLVLPKTTGNDADSEGALHFRFDLRNAILVAFGCVAGEKGCPYAEPSANLKKGAKGDGVRWVQWMLTECGYSVGRYGVDGDFGNDTRTAVRTFQKDSKLSVDAIVGPLTRAALKAAYEKKEAAR